MTREEAIEILKNPNEMYQGTDGVVGYTFNPNRRNYEAFQLAIKALEEKTCEDAVSREQALLALTGKNLSAKSAEELIRLFNKRINALPPVTPTQENTKWVIKATGFPPEPMTVCAKCGFEKDFNIRAVGYDKIKYCPNCGRKFAEISASSD